MAFARSVINEGPETHSDPLIDLTTGVKINTHTRKNGINRRTFMNCARLHGRSSSKSLAHAKTR